MRIPAIAAVAGVLGGFPCDLTAVLARTTQRHRNRYSVVASFAGSHDFSRELALADLAFE
jgi:hypothetical protein